MVRRVTVEAHVVERLLFVLLAASSSACSPPVDDTTSSEVVPTHMDDSPVGTDASDGGDDSEPAPGDGSDGYDPPPGDGSDPVPMDDAGGTPREEAGSPPDVDAGDESSDGWTPVDDGDGSDGSSVTDGGMVVETDAGDCRVLPHNTDSGPFGTTGAVCFVLEQQPPTAWAAYNIDGRTIRVNGTAVSAGELPLPGVAPFIVQFSAGTYAYASWSYW